MRAYTRIMSDPCHCITLRKAAAAATALYDRALAPVGIRVTMYRLLRHVQAAQPISITALAVRMGLDRSTLGRNLRVLERQGLIVVDGAEDARSRHVVLSPRGDTALAQARPLWKAAQADMARRIGPQGMAALDALATLAETPLDTRSPRATKDPAHDL